MKKIFSKTRDGSWRAHGKEGTLQTLWNVAVPATTYSSRGLHSYIRSQDSGDELFFQYDVKENPPILDEEAHHSPVMVPKK